MQYQKIVTIIGARPQFIKAAAVSRAIATHNVKVAQLNEQQAKINDIILHTGHHFDANMSDVFFSELDIRKPDYHLGIGGGTHGQNTGRMIEAIENVLLQEKPDWVLVYGDTDSTLAGALAAVKQHIPLAHVEAGLRSFNRKMPEEVNRVLTDHAADLLFAPTQTAVTNLLIEGITGDMVQCVGDVMYDASQFYKSRTRRPVAAEIADNSSFVLCTIHRAENTDNAVRLAGIVSILNQLSEILPVVLPLHPRTVKALGRLQCTKLNPMVQVIEPVGFLEMTWLLGHCELVLTDSGGMQKEAYFHQKPCLTIRDETEWIELVEAGFNRLISPLAVDPLDTFTKMKKVNIPVDTGLYGDGDAATKIVNHLISRSNQSCRN